MAPQVAADSINLANLPFAFGAYAIRGPLQNDPNIPCKDWTIVVTQSPTNGVFKGPGGANTLWPTGNFDYQKTANSWTSDTFKYKVRHCHKSYDLIIVLSL